MKLKLLKSNENGKTYQADGFKILHRKKGSTSGDNKENVKEHMYLVNGWAKVTINEQAKTYEAPAAFIIPAKTYHKIDAITDIAIVML